MTHTPEVKEPEYAIRISAQYPIAEGKGVVFETYAPLSVDIKVLHGIMDKLRCVAERQEAITKVALLAKQLEAENAHLKALEGDVEKIRQNATERWVATGRKGAYKLTEAEGKALGNIESTTTSRKLSIQILEAELAHYQALVDMVV